MIIYNNTFDDGRTFEDIIKARKRGNLVYKCNDSVLSSYYYENEGVEILYGDGKAPVIAGKKNDKRKVHKAPLTFNNGNNYYYKNDIVKIPKKIKIAQVGRVHYNQ